MLTTAVQAYTNVAVFLVRFQLRFQLYLLRVVFRLCTKH